MRALSFGDFTEYRGGAQYFDSCYDVTMLIITQNGLHRQMDFSQIQGVISDMDGVLWRGTEPLPSITEFVEFLRERDIPLALATNNSMRTPAMYVEKLASMGVEGIQPEQIITSGVATAIFVSENHPPGTKIYPIGLTGVREPLLERGFELVESDAEVVVVGADHDLTYATVKKAALQIRAGAKFYGTNPDKTYPTPEGLAPGTGSIIAFVKAATDVEAIIIGKPEVAMFEMAAKVIGTKPENTLMIGDRLNTDIAGAIHAGMKSAMVLTGVSSREEAESGDVNPDVIFDGLPELLDAWRSA